MKTGLNCEVWSCGVHCGVSFCFFLPFTRKVKQEKKRIIRNSDMKVCGNVLGELCGEPCSVRREVGTTNDQIWSRPGHVMHGNLVSLDSNVLLYVQKSRSERLMETMSGQSLC